MFKINISEKSGKTYKLEAEAEEFIGKILHDKISGEEILPDLKGYEFEITGASDKAGFTAMENVEGVGLARVLLKYGKAMHKRPRREGKKKVSNPKPKGLRMRRTVRGQVISPEIIQINLKILKEGGKKLSEIFPDQNKKEEVAKEEVSSDISKENSKPKGNSGANAVKEGGELSKTPKQEKNAESQNDSENKELINKKNSEPERFHESASQQKRVGSGDEGEANVSEKAEQPQETPKK